MPDWLDALRLVAAPPTIDSFDETVAGGSARLLRIASDEALIARVPGSAGPAPPLGPIRSVVAHDPTAMVVPDDGWLVWRAPDPAAAAAFLETAASWQLDRDEDFGQGLVAGVPAKIWVVSGTVHLLATVATRVDLEARLPRTWT